MRSLDWASALPLTAVRSTPSRRSPRVVVAEDDQDTRALVTEALEREGYNVTALPDGARLLVRIGRQYRQVEPEPAIDLIVTDLRMPVITGLQILQGLRNAGCETPLILMTAFGDTALHHRVGSLGAVLFEKPVQLREVCECARRLLGLAPRHGGA